MTFMAKFDERYAGSSMHLHSSLWSRRAATPLFAGDDARARRPSALPDLFRWWLGGLMHHARACTLLFAPYVNSYKRFRAGSFAPTAIAWSLRQPHRRLPHRRQRRRRCASSAASRAPTPTRTSPSPRRSRPGSTASPSTSSRRRCFAATSTPPATCRACPATLPEAIAEFESSALFREAFGADVVEHLVHFARTEQRKFDETVTTWERRRYLERA